VSDFRHLDPGALSDLRHPRRETAPDHCSEAQPENQIGGFSPSEIVQ